MESISLPKVQKILQFNSNIFAANKPQQLQQQQDLKNAGIKHTEAFEIQMHKQLYQTRSIKRNTQQQISFEQNFMSEHHLANQRQFNKYIEYQDNIFQKVQQKIQIKKVINSQINIGGQTQIEKILKNSTNYLLNNQQTQRFIIDLRRQDKFKDFLQFIIPKFDDDAKVQILYLANLLWEEYILIQQNGYVYQQIVQFAEYFVQRQIKNIDEKLKIINFKQLFNMMDQYSNISKLDKVQRFNKFKDFAMYLCLTFALIIGGFFDNPYLKKNQGVVNYKRGISSIQGGEKFNFGSLNDKQDQYGEKDQQNQEESEENGFYLSKRLKP